MTTPSKYLDVCTAHVRQETMNPGLNPYFIAEYEYGAFFYVPLEIEADTPEDLAAVLRLAKANGCTLVRLDCDGESYAELETYDW